MAIHTLSWNAAPPEACRHGAVAIGNFDGVHRGHQSLLEELRRQAQSTKGPAVVLSFEPHPSLLLRPETPPPALTTSAERAHLLQLGGADHVVILTTTHELLSLPAEDFFQRVLQDHFSARALVEGNDFRFGRNREGDTTTLTALCGRGGMTLTIVPPVLLNGTGVSSSRVRMALGQGNVSEAAQCLGRPYRLSGIVGKGEKRGRRLGFPTANLEQCLTLIPADGVYAVRVKQDGKTWAGAANIGPNPTFREHTRKVEVHLVDFQGDLYGQSLEVDFLERIRATQTFSDIDELIAQLHRDVARARLACVPS